MSRAPSPRTTFAHPTPDRARVARDTVLWSGERESGFTPCRLADARACWAPPG